MLWNKGLDYIAYDICTLPSFPLKTYFFCLPLKITYNIAIPEDFHKILVYCWEIWENYASVNSRAQLELTDALNRGRSDIIRYYLMQLCIFFYIILIIWYNMNFVTFDMYFIKRINIITTIVHISQEILIKECFVQIACRWRRSTVSHLSLTAPRHFLLPAYVGRISLPNSSITAKSSEYFPGEFWLGATEDWTEAGVAEEEPTAEIQNFLISKRIRRE